MARRQDDGGLSNGHSTSENAISAGQRALPASRAMENRDALQWPVPFRLQARAALQGTQKLRVVLNQLAPSNVESNTDTEAWKAAIFHEDEPQSTTLAADGSQPSFGYGTACILGPRAARSFPQDLTLGPGWLAAFGFFLPSAPLSGGFSGPCRPRRPPRRTRRCRRRRPAAWPPRP